MSRKKSIAFTTFLLILVILAIISSVFLNNAEACGNDHWHRHRRPPLGKIIIKHFVYPDGTPIGECLEVELWDDGNEPIAYGHTDPEGTVTFSGLPDGTYTFEWYWQGEHYSEMFRINCEQLVWEFWNEVPYWTVIKTFYYNTVPPIPVSHLAVTMNGYSGITDETGTVVFSNVKAGSYTIAWVWGGVQQTEDLEIDFQTPTPIELTNYLPPKSWWRQK